MTSVDSGVETSNDSSDSCVAHDTKALEVGSIKVSSNVTHVIVANLCPLNTPSSSNERIEMKEQKSESARLVISKPPAIDVEPPAGISFCNLQPSYGLGKGYEIVGSAYQSSDLTRKCYARPKCWHRAKANSRTSWLSFKGPLDERKLRYAASTNNEEQVDALLNSGVNPNCYDDQYRNPLHLSACRGYSNVVRLLLEKGANPNQRDSLGNTPLHLAACTNHVEVVTLLLKAGTDVNSSDSFGRNPLQLAQSKLKLLQRGSNNEDSWKIKQEVQKWLQHLLANLRDSSSTPSTFGICIGRILFRLTEVNSTSYAVRANVVNWHVLRVKAAGGGTCPAFCILSQGPIQERGVGSVRKRDGTLTSVSPKDHISLCAEPWGYPLPY